MILAIILIPMLAGLLTFFINSDRVKKFVLLAVSFSHLLLSILSFFFDSGKYLGGMIALDKIGSIFLCVMSLLFFLSVLYAISYMSIHGEEHKEHPDEGFIFADSPKKLFISSLLIFCGTMSLVCTSRHLGVLWVAIEATTFASAPLVYYYHTRESLEATWKYVMICSVGIGLSLIGNILIMLAYKTNTGTKCSLILEILQKNASDANKGVLAAAFIFFLVGYGTKTGLAPLHSWLPSTHGESPPFISAILSGALLNCALLGILRVFSVCINAGIYEFSGKLMIFIGLFSVLIAAFFMAAQNDYKRMLAYSSVEHMGLALLAFGLGSSAILPALLHVINHSLTKASLFLCSGNILSAFETKKINNVKGMFKVIPFSSSLWFIGILAICGLPPFGLFITEFMIFKEIFAGRHYLVAVLLALSLLILFSAMIYKTIEMFSGEPSITKSSHITEKFLPLFPSLLLLILTLVLGLYLPDFFIKYLGNVSKEFYL